MSEEKKTAGIAPAQTGALQVLQFTPRRPDDGVWKLDVSDRVGEAAEEVSYYHAPKGTQAARHHTLSAALQQFLRAIVENVDPGPERSTAISRAREAKMWASAGIALE